MNQQVPPWRGNVPYPSYQHPQQFSPQSFPQPSEPRRSIPWILIGSVIGCALLLCLVIGGLLYAGTLQRALLAVEPNCTVGITGTAATLTIEGWSANRDCQNLVSGKPSFLGTVSPSNVYLYTGTPTNPVVCETDVQGRHVIVRDEGVLKLVGNALCQALLLPTPTPQPA